MIEALSTEEQDEITINALLGSIEDLSIEFSDENRERSDLEIMSAVQGVYKAGSEHFNSDLAKTFGLFDQFASRLGELACNHDHFMQSIGQTEAADKHAHNDHDHKSTEDEEIDPKTGKKKKKKRLFQHF